MRLFYFPYAGGGASIFRRWTAPPHIEIRGVQLPGREDRFTEPLCRAVDDPETTLAELEDWKVHTRAFGGVRFFRGDHFYLQSQAPTLIDAMVGAVWRQS
ncbi:MAG: hypothetical protein EXQ59_03420 [Acidobacteria bacterium]|nr:hypothetical protein [Acidobacteriota bacterium]